ncbi:MAG TPA: regulatory protein RecX [Firmicutes bacterium]|nr:regulatory protein RecX [Bacillota bacterium]
MGSKEDIEKYILRLLSQRDYTAAMLKQKLALKGYPASESEEAINKIEKLYPFDDEGYAVKWINYRCDNKPVGGTRLVRELIQKGVKAATAREIVLRQLPREKEQKLLEELVTKIIRRNQAHVDSYQKAARLLGAKLQRRGFAREDIESCLNKIFPD